MGESPVGTSADPQLWVAVSADPTQRLSPYVPRLVVDWLRNEPERSYREVEGSLAFVDISGFTTLTERLARKGKVGAEEMSDTLNATFAALLGVAYQDGAGLVKWGGDAVLLLFDRPGHAARSCRAAHRMRAKLREIGRLQTSAGRITLRMSVGIHSGTFHFFLVGAPTYHRELIVSGPAASVTAVMEATADAGQIAISPQAAALLPVRCVGKTKGEAILLRSEPEVDRDGIIPASDTTGLDLASVLPVDIRSHLLAQPGEAEHRTIAVAFVQFSGTDALLEAEGPAALANALHEVIANVQEATATHGVTFFETDINRDGGKIMLTAGAPVSRGHDEDRMLRAARVIIERAGRLPLRIGVNRGAVFSGDFGPVFRRTYSVKGDAINLAARVMGKAAPGQVLATRAAFDRARTRFDSEDLPPFMVKGKAKPVDAVRLGPVHATGERESRVPPLAGRREELAVLDAALDALRGGRGGLVRVLGEPGMGKTRLVQELRTRASDLRVLSTACDEYEENIPYLPVRRLLCLALGAPVDEGQEAISARLRDCVAEHAGDLLPWLPLLAIVAGVPAEPTRETRELDEAFRKGRLEEVTTGLLAALLDEPTLVVVEDVDYLDEASRDLLLRLADERANLPWLVVTSARTGDDRFVPQDRLPHVRMDLARLDPSDAYALLVQETEDAPLPPASMQTLVERSEGNPLFLFGLLAAVRGSAAVDRLPDTVEDLATAEIDRLSPQHRRMLRYAAVLGMTVDEDLLRDLLDDPALPAGAGAFRPLQEFMTLAGPGRLRFRHALIRDAAYDGLPYRRRRALHERVGTMLLERMPDPASTPEPLAMHFFHAGRASDAWTYARMAGWRAREHYAQAEAARFLEWAVESARRAEVPVHDQAEVLEALGDVRYFLGLSSEAAQAYRQALHLLRGDPVRQAELLLKEGRLAQRAGNLTLSLRRLSRGMRLVEGMEQPRALDVHSQLATRYAIGRYQAGRITEARVWGERGVQLGEHGHALQAQADAHNLLQAIASWQEQSDEVSHGETALRLYEQIGDLSGASYALNNLALHAIFDGRWDQALDHLSRAAAIFAQTGDEAGLAMAVYNQADVLIRQGRAEDAEPLLRKALRVARSVGAEELAAYALRETGKVSARLGHFDAAREQLAASVEALNAIGAPQEVADARAAVAETFLLEGKWEEATRRVGEQLLEDGLPPRVTATLQRVRGFALLHRGDFGSAREAFQAGLVLSDSPTTRHERAFIQEGLALVDVAQGVLEAELRHQSSLTALEELGVVALPVPAALAAPE